MSGNQKFNVNVNEHHSANSSGWALPAMLAKAAVLNGFGAFASLSVQPVQSITLSLYILHMYVSAQNRHIKATYVHSMFVAI